MVTRTHVLRISRIHSRTRDSNEQEQIPFSPSLTVPRESVEGHDDEVQVEVDIEVEVEDEGEEEEEGDLNPRSSKEPLSFSGRHGAPNSLSSLGPPVPSHCPSRFVTWPEGAACRPRAHLLSPSRVPLRHHKARVHQTANRTRRVAQAIWRQRPLASSSPSGGSPTSAVSPSSSVPSPKDVRGMFMPSRHPAAGGGCQHPSTAPNTVSPTPAGVLTASRPRQTSERHRRQLRQGIGLEVLEESDRKDDRASLSDSLHLMDHSKRTNAKILLDYCLHLHLSRALGHRYLVHATAVWHPSHESAALSDPALVHEIPARVRLQAAGVHDTIPMSQSLAHHSRLDVPAHTA